MLIFNIFKQSSLELKNIRCVVTTALFIAISVVLQALTIYVTPFLRVNFSFVGSAAVGMLFGPVVSVMSAATADILGYFVQQSGQPFNPWFTLISMLGGLINGLLLYKIDFGIMTPKDIFKKKLNKSEFSAIFRVVLARTLIVSICYVILNTIVLQHMGQIPVVDNIWFTYVPRIIKNAALLPVEILISIFVLIPVQQSYKRIYLKKGAI